MKRKMWGPLPHIFNKFICVYVIIYVWVHKYVCAYRGQREISSVFIRNYQPLFLRQGLLLAEAHQLS